MTTKNDIRQLWEMERRAFAAGVYDVYARASDNITMEKYNLIRQNVPVIGFALSKIGPEHTNLTRNILIDLQDGSNIVPQSVKNNFLAGRYAMEAEIMKADYGKNIINIAEQRIQEVNSKEQEYGAGKAENLKGKQFVDPYRNSER